jgi:hypothetical protein
MTDYSYNFPEMVANPMIYHPNKCLEKPNQKCDCKFPPINLVESKHDVFEQFVQSLSFPPISNEIMFERLLKRWENERLTSNKRSNEEENSEENANKKYKLNDRSST